MLSGRTVICVSTLDWDAPWQAPQQICAELASHGSPVLYVENTGVRSPQLGDGVRILQRAFNWLSGRGRYRQVRDRLFLYSPLALPFPYSALARLFNRITACRSIARWSLRRGDGQPILLTFLPTPFALDLAEMLRPALSVYYSAARFAESSPGARRIEAVEKKVIQTFDFVMAISHDLAEHCRRFRRDVERVPLGVDLSVFEPGWKGQLPIPRDIAGLPRPLVGYVGMLHGVLDQELLVELSARMPEASFVLVGPRCVSTRRLEGRPNVHLLGHREHAQVPAYIGGFDVCLIPYRVNDYSDGVYPSKLNEYLALGKPVVSTPIAEIHHFIREFGDVVTVANGATAQCQAIRAHLSNSPEAVRRRREVAVINDWGARVRQIAALLEKRLPS